MKKNIYLLFVVTLFSLQAFAQDKLYKKNGDVIEAKVLEVNEAEIKYKIFTDQEGPTYTVDKDRLSKIVYQSGREETRIRTSDHEIKQKLCSGGRFKWRWCA